MRLLITGAWNASRQQLEQLEAMGHEVIWHQQERDALPVAYDAVEGVICNGLFLHHPIEKFTSLSYIQLTSAGFDRVPMDYVREKGIRIRNARDVYSIPMAEFALCGVLQLYKQSRFFEKNQAAGQWVKHRGLLELAGKTVVILGCGSVGTACAERFRAFGCKVIGINRSLREDRAYDSMAPLEQLDALLPEADVLVLTLPLTEQTRHLMDRERFEKMKPGAVLVNIARGPVVDSEALIRWLEADRGSAVLDVFEEEPLAVDSALWHLENVILTPHNSFVGEGNGARLASVILGNLEKIC